ncbi:MAG: TerB family tellurite resistance protein [Bacteroidales bacterium]|nr:TerB family tellurite resistance protein [Bacteroidales bacterium]
MERNELYLKTAFCCMVCDGDIADEEITLLKNMTANDNIFEGLDIQGKLDEYVAAINKDGQVFLKKYLEEVKNAKLDNESSLMLIKIAINTIEVDEEIKYSEVSFFKQIRKNLSISDETILEAMPDKEDYLLPDIEDDSLFDYSYSFQNIIIADETKSNDVPKSN